MSIAATDLRTHRPPWAPVVAVVWFVVATVLLVDLVRRGDGSEIVTGVLALGSSVLIAYVFGLQPCLEEHPDGVFVKNPLRRVRLRWADVRDVIPRDVLVLVTDAGEVRCGGVVSRGRAAEAGRQATKLMYPSARGADLADTAVESRSDPESVAARLIPRWEAAGRRADGTSGTSGTSGDVRLRWHVPSLLMVVAAVLMMLAAAAVV